MEGNKFSFSPWVVFTEHAFCLVLGTHKGLCFCLEAKNSIHKTLDVILSPSTYEQGWWIQILKRGNLRLTKEKCEVWLEKGGKLRRGLSEI